MGDDRRIKLGRKGEALAISKLKQAGLLVVARNVRIGGGEIDIVAMDGDELVIVEVRSNTNSQVDPLSTINHVKQRQLKKLGALYSQKLGHQGMVRFDAVGVRFGSANVVVEHLVDAF